MSNIVVMKQMPKLYDNVFSNYDRVDCVPKVYGSWETGVVALCSESLWELGI